MTDEHQPNRQQDHWRELAELLGLNPESPKAASPIKETPLPVRAEVHEVPKVMPKPMPLPPRQIPDPVGTTAARPEPFQAHAEPIREPAHLPQATHPEVATVAAAAPSETAVNADDDSPAAREERPRRGRRGRRGRRNRPDDQTQPSLATDKTASSRKQGEADEVDETPPQLGQYPRREALQPLEDEADDEVLEAVSSAADDDLDDDDNLSDWTVPSWTELIASLYRPER